MLKNNRSLKKKASPNRFAAKKVHDAVICKIAELLKSKKIAKNLLDRAKSINKKDPIKADIKRYNNKVINLDRKLEMLTERLTELPKNVSAKLIYSKMATLEKQKKEITTLLEVRKLVSKIELGANEIKIWFHVGDEYIKRELATASSSFLSFLEKSGSSNLTSGGPS